MPEVTASRTPKQQQISLKLCVSRVAKKLSRGLQKVFKAPFHRKVYSNTARTPSPPLHTLLPLSTASTSVGSQTTFPFVMDRFCNRNLVRLNSSNNNSNKTGTHVNPSNNNSSKTGTHVKAQVSARSGLLPNKAQHPGKKQSPDSTKQSSGCFSGSELLPSQKSPLKRSSIASHHEPHTPRVAGGSPHAPSLQRHAPSGIDTTSTQMDHHHKHHHHHSSTSSTSHYTRHSHTSVTSTSPCNARPSPINLNPKLNTDTRRTSPAPPSPLSQPPAYMYPKILEGCNTYPTLSVVDRSSKPSSPLDNTAANEPQVTKNSSARQRRMEEKMSSSHMKTRAGGSSMRHKMTNLNVEAERNVGQNQPIASSTLPGNKAVADSLNYAIASHHHHNHHHHQKNQHRHRRSSSESSTPNLKHHSSPVDLDLHQLDLSRESKKSSVHLAIIKPQDEPKDYKSHAKTHPNLSPPTTSSTTMTPSVTKLPYILSPALQAESSVSNISRNRVRKFLNQFFHKKSKASVVSNFSNKGTQLSLEVLEAAYLRGGVVGLFNLGNTCYMNSMVQCLSHTLEMTNLFLTQEFSSGLCFEYGKVLNSIWLSSLEDNPSFPSSSSSSWLSPLRKPSVMPLRKFKDRINTILVQFSGYHQHDAQEFLRHFISRIHSEMKVFCRNDPLPHPKLDYSVGGYELGKIVWKWVMSVEGSPIASVFMGMFKSSLQCDFCKHTSLTFDPYWDIGLPIAKIQKDKSNVDLYSCFSVLTQEEVMDGDNSPICEECEKPRRSIIKTTIHQFPPVLCLYLKRFHATMYGYRCKLSTAVQILHKIDLTSYASPETVGHTGGDGRICYELYAVSNHCGSLYAGHYTADIKHFATQDWFTCNDSSITKNTFLPSSQPSFASTEAYVLFYRRVQPSLSPGPSHNM